MKHIGFSILLLLILTVSACSAPLEPGETQQPALPTTETGEEPGQDSPEANLPLDEPDFLVSKADRLEAPPVSDPITIEQVTGNNQFAFELLHQLSADANLGSTNLFYSPYSISSALAMAYAGARNQTEAQMENTLHYAGQTNTHTAFNALNQYFEGLNAISEESEWEDFSLNINNALWGEQSFALAPEYLDTLSQYYGAGYNAIDFINQPDAARLQINDWVSERTNQKIQDLLAPGTVNSATRVVLTNTIYFIASWVNEFDELNTQDETFTLLDGSTVQAPTMMNSERYAYGAGDGYEIIELPYNGYQTSLIILLPTEGTFEDFEKQLTTESFTAMRESLTFQEVDLYLPKFKAESAFNVNEMLSALGMTDAFDPASADFSGITGANDLFISNVIHKAIIDLDEKGTEAAAATAVTMELTSAMPNDVPPVELRIDSPFIYAIINPESGSILFLGHLLNPNQ